MFIKEQPSLRRLLNISAEAALNLQKKQYPTESRGNTCSFAFFIRTLSLHNRNCVVFLYNQPQFFDHLSMLAGRFHDVDAGGVDAGMSQYICQLGDVFSPFVKASGEKFSQIVRKDLAAFHSGFFTQRFHLCPDVAAV